MAPKKKIATKGKKVITRARQKKETQKVSPKEQKKPDNKTKKTSAKEEKETKKKPSNKANKYCVVVYSTGECEVFDSEEQARIERQSLPVGMVKSYEVFETLRSAMQFKNLPIKNKKPECEPSDRSNSDGDADKAMVTAVTPDQKMPVASFLKLLGSSSARIPEDRKMQAGLGKPSQPFLSAIAHKVFTVSTVLRVFVIKFKVNQIPPLPAGYKMPKKQVIVFDLFDQKKNTTYWTHKAKTWVNLFKTAQDTQKSLFDNECYLLKSFQFRDLSARQASEPKFFQYTNARGGKVKIAVEGWFVMVPFSWTISNIRDFAVKIGKNMMKPDAKQAYGLYFRSSSETFQKCIDSTAGEYWKTIEGVFQKENISIIQKEALAEIFTNDMVMEIMADLFDDDRRPEDWDDVHRMMYAFSNLLDSGGLVG
jgi:hypothetical protein